MKFIKPIHESQSSVNIKGASLCCIFIEYYFKSTNTIYIIMRKITIILIYLILLLKFLKQYKNIPVVSIYVINSKFQNLLLFIYCFCIIHFHITVVIFSLSLSFLQLYNYFLCGHKWEIMEDFFNLKRQKCIPKVQNIVRHSWKNL